ncbi:E3 ubiquitin-protein ligase UBR2 isoform X5 [Channa argus]|uniref:E3 ubiquitin-protein ligase UBR2 isoform X5 n=1 Tax=Channa argus TaxID=215402 RepID=UPI00352034A4
MKRATQVGLTGLINPGLELEMTESPNMIQVPVGPLVSGGPQRPRSSVSAAVKAAARWALYSCGRWRQRRSKLTGLQMETRYRGLAEDDEGDEEQRDETDTTNKNQNKKLLDHFRHLAATNQDTDQVDLQFLDQVISDGADPNSCDRYGQTVLHEISRAWSVDVMRFFLDRGSDLLRPDQFGVTALHVASALDYQDMVQFLLEQKADPEASTLLDQQTPLHYAAKNDAVGSIHRLLQAGASINCTDYKNRTPLQLAANLERSDAARVLLELGAEAGTKDTDGQLCITALIGRMGPVVIVSTPRKQSCEVMIRYFQLLFHYCFQAQLALNQFLVTDKMTRQQYYYLNLLEPESEPHGPENHLQEAVLSEPTSPPSQLQVVVQNRKLDLIMHPVFLKLIQVKWKLYGRLGAWLLLILNLLFIVSWTTVAISVSVHRDSPDRYVLPQDWWRVLLVVLALLLTLEEVLREVQDIWRSKRKLCLWQQWAEHCLQDDLHCSHPMWPQERLFLLDQNKQIHRIRGSYSRDLWNVFDWLVYSLLMVSFTVHVADVVSPSTCLHTVSLRLFSVTIIFLWLRLMKHVRAFRLMGPFIVMLGNIVGDVMCFLFLYAEIFIPYACSFWIIFGGTLSVPSMQSVSGLLYSLYRITLVDEYEFAAMVTVDKVMAPLLCGTFLAASSILCINLLIALLSDTFQRVHDNSQANAVMQQAAVILQVEESMPLLRHFYDNSYISTHCAPLADAYNDDITTDPCYHNERGHISAQIKETLDEFLVLQRDLDSGLGSSLRAEGGNMAVAESDRDPSSALCSEFLSFSAKDTASRWLVTADLQQEVYRHLAVYVPKILCVGPNGGVTSREEQREEQREDLACQLLLLAPLEWLLLGEEPAAGLAHLQENNQPSPLCGHVFKAGEPTYSCRECAADPTCVLCMQCFLGSVHRDHRYRMTTSVGGGFCDCGDAEAWKKGPYCQKHTPADTSRNNEEDPVDQLPVDLVARGYSIFSIILRYAVDLLTWEQEDQLPAGLEPPERGDTYYCMLFNDEVHTYEQVIYTLQKAVNCSQKEAVSFATTVDRDGRKSVRYGDFQFCDQAKSVIVRNTSRQSKPLRVQVMHSSVVAHQCFALKALSWLGQIIQYSDGLRRILCQVGLQKGPEGENSSLVDRLMLNDSMMWKGARNIYHQLLMNSLLMDIKYKKIFAIQFAKSYERLQSDYVKDDHDREFSITDLSVQIFTVPSLARMLMVEENLMTTIIRTFVDHLRHRDVQGRFQFDRYTAQQAFKFARVHSLIGDLKYVLISCPSEWSDELRAKFLEGLDAFLELLKCMQGMDPVVRQVGQHIEMEPEWEAAFTLQMKLTHIISMIQEWCSTDERVLIEAYRKCLSALSHCHSSLPDGEQPIILSLAGHSVETFRYQVSQDKVSIHLPVCRLLAGLHVLLSRTEVAYRFPEQLPLGELSPPLLIELPLRCLVLCAQVHAGMWRRNGFSLINQIYYYHNVKCRVEMFDKDVTMLQAGASMMDSNHFLMIVLSRFELFHIFSSSDIRKRYREANKDVVQQNNTLIEEMLHLIIMVVGERYVAGVGQVEPFDEVRREIIHQLSIRPMAHSELVKALPENGNKETGLERVIDSVASFKKPGVTGRGLYELRPEWNKHFNLYFHHYSRADQSKAEEAQRKLRRQNGEDTALPPPLPPPLFPLFASLVNLLQCDVLLAVEGAVLQWAMEPSGGGWTESMLQRVLHLVGMALLEEQQQLENSSSDDDITFNYTSKITRPGEAPNTSGSVLALLESLQNAPHLEVHKDMITWILKMVTNIKTMRERTSSTSTFSISPEHGLEETVRDKDKAERKRKAEMARLRREKIMAQMSEMQKHFINENKELFQQSLEELEASTSAAAENSPPSLEPTCVLQVCVGPRRVGRTEGRQLVTCILCQEEQEVRGHGRAMVLAAFVQRSTVLSKNRRHNLPDPDSHNPLFMHPDMSLGVHTASCGHIMHATCWQRYFEAVQLKEQRRQQRLRGHTSYDVENGEFLCPLCECLSNTVIPLLPHAHSPDRSVNHPSLEVWLKTAHHQIAALHSAYRKQSDGAAEAETACPEGFRVDFTPQNPFSSSISEMITTFSMSTYKIGLKLNPNEQDHRIPVLSWSTCAFTIQSIECLLMDEEKPLFGSLPCRQDDCLSSLTRFSAACWTTAPLETVHTHFIRLFAVLVPDSRVENTPCILDIDMFHLLVYSVLSYSSVHCLDQSGTSLLDSAHLHLLQLVTVAHLVQILLTFTPEEVFMDQDNGSEEEELTSQLYNILRKDLGSVLPEVSSGWQLWRCVKAGVLPFLRAAALFFHYLNSTVPPADLLVSGPGQWEALCSYLSLPSNLLQLHNSHLTLLEPLIHRWCCHPGVRKMLQGEGVLVRFPRESNRLIELPEDYSVLINQASSFTCPRSGGDKSRAPTLCLVCGSMLCSQSYCCQTEVDGEDVGACTAHTFTCGAGLGLFLRVRESQVLFVAGKTKGCFYPPPYLDDYGETDQGLKRGNPLHLCLERYRKIERLWRQHAVAEVIGHAQEANQSLVAIDWQHL